MNFGEQIKNIREYQLSLIHEEKGKVLIDETKLDLFKQIDSSLIPDWKPSVTLEPYHSIRRVSLDIETTGLDNSNDQVKSIGIAYLDTEDFEDIKYRFFVYGKDVQGLSEKFGNIKFYDEEDECLEGALKYLFSLRKDPFTILEHHNGFNFDLPFLEERCRQWGVSIWSDNVWKCPYETVDSTAQMFGKPSKYHSYYIKGFELVDTMHKALSWDFVARKLTGGVGLKNVVYELGIETETRVELEYWELFKVYKENNWRTVLSYLKDDLKATLKLGDFLIPSYYYQLRLLPHWRLQAIFTRGNGSKWNDILLREYHGNVSTNKKKAKTELQEYAKYLEAKGIKTDTRRSYKGGKTGGTAILARNIGKLDVASLYPSIMLNYGICSHKDTEFKFLSILNYAWKDRIKLKHNPDKDAQMLQGSLKVIINSGYGALGTGGIIFNDYKMAALVTAYGRAILDLMDKSIIEFGGRSLELDTDGIYFSYDGDHKDLLDYVQSKMPKGIKLENELFAKGAYIPPYQFKVTNYEVGVIPEEYPGLKKNYILVDVDEGKGIKPLKVSGIFRNRSMPRIYKEFIPELVRDIIHEGCDLSDEEFQCNTKKLIQKRLSEKIVEIYGGKIDLDFLMITRKAKKSKDPKSTRRPDAKVYDNNCVETDEYGIDIARYFLAQQPGKTKDYTKQTFPVSLKNLPENINHVNKFYIDRLVEMTETLAIFSIGKKLINI